MAQHSAPRSSVEPPSAAPASRRSLVLWALLGVVAVLAAVVGVGALSGSSPDAPAPPAAPVAAGPAAVADAVAVVGELPASTTFTTVDAAPPDTGAGTVTDGTVVHPTAETLVHDAAGGRAIARMEPTQIGDTWLPVIAEQPGWVQVLLPSKPNGSTGWLAADGLERARSPYMITVHLASKKLELLRDGKQVGEWTVGIGKKSAPTPVGRTFLLGAFSDAKQHFSPVILPLGTHSPTHDSFGGGPGTVALHTWPTDDVYGTATSDGCIRVPPDALRELSEVPLGTLVMIDER